MKQILFLLLLFFIFSSCDNSSVVLNEIGEFSGTLKEKLCPDDREGLYNVDFISKEGRIIVRGETNLPEAKKELLEALDGKGVEYTDSLVVLPDNPNDSLTWGLVNISVCNLRISPTHEAEMVSQAILGTPVRVLKKNSSWYLVQTPDNYISWVDDDAIFLLTEKQFADNRKEAKMVYLPDFGLAVNSETKKVVTDIVAGSILRLVKKDGKQSILSMPDGRQIEVSSSDVVDFKEWCNKKRSVEDISNTALNFMGRPYLWGGTSTKGIDCSGFVKTVYFLNGYILPRDASLQFLHGDVITLQQGWKELKAGDLVFFGRQATDDKPAKATHVGYYLGNSEYVHSSGYVKVNSFDPKQKNYSKYRTVSWLGGRRFLDVKTDGIIRVADHPWY